MSVYREFVDSREGFDSDEGADWADFERHLDAMEESRRLERANLELSYVGFVADVFQSFVEALVQGGEMVDAGPIDEMIGV